MSLFHFWTPQSLHETLKPIRIPSNNTIHSAVHIGITPLYHAHLIGVKSSLQEGKELYVISHDPEDPTANYENIRLTQFSAPLQGKHDLGRGTAFLRGNVRGRVFLPEKPTGPTILYIHGDEEGGAWHDWWMPYWNPNSFLDQGYTVIQVNPTGAEGYGDRET